MGARLVQPPPSRLAVVRPTEAQLPDAAAAGFVPAMTEALLRLEVPAISSPPNQGDWQLKLSVQRQGAEMVPLYTVFDATGAQAGVQQGLPVPAKAWMAGSPATLRAAAASAAPGIADLLTRIDAARRASDPNSLMNRQARLRVPDVTGAPGDGNRQLARQMRTQLSQEGLLVQDAPGDFTVAGQVRAVPIAGHMTRIEIQWVVSDSKGDERGRIVQLNEIPAGSLDRYWGDVAVMVAQEAASGVKDVVARQTGASAK